VPKEVQAVKSENTTEYKGGFKYYPNYKIIHGRC